MRNQNKKSGARVQTCTAFYKNSKLIIRILSILKHQLWLLGKPLLKQLSVLEITEKQKQPKKAGAEYRFEKQSFRASSASINKQE